MNYKEKILEYAEIVQLVSSQEHLIDNAIIEKIAQHGTDLEKHGFWKKVQGRIYQTVGKAPYRVLRSREIKYRDFVSTVPGVEYILNAPNLRDWINALPEFKRELEYINTFQTQMNIREVPDEVQKLLVTRESLGFYNEALKESTDIHHLVKYIPLTYTTLNDLIATDNYSSDFNSFVKTNIIPVFRAHSKIVNEFLELIELEEKLYKYEQQNNTSIKSSDKANIFTEEEEILGEENSYDFKVPEYYLKPIELSYQHEYKGAGQDPFLIGLDLELVDVINGKPTSRMIKEEVIKSWKLSPLSDLLFRRILSDKIGVTTQYTAVVPPRVMETANRILYANIKFYSEDSLLQMTFMGLDSCMYKYQSEGEGNLALYHSLFTATAEAVEINIDKLIKMGLVTAKKALDALEVRLERGEALGLRTTF